MKISSQQLNSIHNALRELVGEQGAFVLFAVKPDGEAEDLQIRISGPDVRLVGLLSVSSDYIKKHMDKKVNERLSPLPKEPD